MSGSTESSVPRREPAIEEAFLKGSVEPVRNMLEACAELIPELDPRRLPSAANLARMRSSSSSSLFFLSDIVILIVACLVGLHSPTVWRHPTRAGLLTRAGTGLAYAEKRRCVLINCWWELIRVICTAVGGLVLGCGGAPSCRRRGGYNGLLTLLNCAWKVGVGCLGEIPLWLERILCAETTLSLR